MNFPGQHRRHPSHVVVCEQDSCWAVSLRRMLPESIRVRETRALSDCREMLASAGGLAAVEWQSDKGGAILEWLGQLRRFETPAAAILLGASKFNRWTWAAREAGALEAVATPRDLTRLRPLLTRYFERAASCEFATIREEVLAGLPWQTVKREERGETRNG